MDGVEKTDLAKRLADLKDGLAYKTAKDLTDKLTPTSPSEDIKKAQDATDVVVNPDKKKELQDAIDNTKSEIAKNIADVTDKISKLPTPITKEAIKEVQDLIDKLPTGTDKSDAQAKLDYVVKAQEVADLAKQVTEITDKITALVPPASEQAIKDIQDLIDKLPTGTAKEVVQTKLNDFLAKEASDLLAKNVAEATAKVANIVPPVNPKDLADAQTSVDRLPSGAEKDALQAKLDALKQAYLEKTATDLVVKAETSKLPEDCINARGAVDALKDGTVKTDLTARLNNLGASISVDEISKLIDALTPQSTAESIQAIQDAINKLPAGTERDKIQAKLDEVKDTILGTIARTAVEKAENTKARADYEDAKGIVDTLKDGVVKTELSGRLDAISTSFSVDEIADMLDALNYDSPKEELDTIQSAINTLPVCTYKDSLQGRLNDFIDKYNKYHADVDIIDKNLQDIDTAVTLNKLDNVDSLLATTQGLIDSLPASPTKVSLQTRCTNLKNAVIALTSNNAQALIDGIKTSIGGIADAYTATNDTTEDTLLTHLKGRVPEIVSLSLSNFNKDMATSSSEGLVTVKVTIMYNGMFDSVDLKLPITKISSSSKHHSSSSSSSSDTSSSTGSTSSTGTTNNVTTATATAQTANTLINSGSQSPVTIAMDVVKQNDTINTSLQLVLPNSLKTINSLGLNSGASMWNYDWKAIKNNEVVTSGQLGTLAQHNTLQGIVISANSGLDPSTTVDLNLTGVTDAKLSKLYSFNDTLGKFVPSTSALRIDGTKVSFTGTNKSNYLLLASQADALDLGVNGWNKAKNTENWVYVDSENCATGWKKLADSNWYYFGSDGIMKTGWQQVDNSWYYLNSSGVMLHDTTIEGYALGSNGVMIY